MFGTEKIQKKIQIEAMSCIHCAKKVEQALEQLQEVKSVKVILEDKVAKVVLKQEVSEETLKAVIEEAGYQVIQID